MPDISPDGLTIAFYSTKDDSGEIYTMRIDSSQVEKVTETPVIYVSSLPRWGSSQKIIFNSNRSGTFSSYVIDVRDATSVELLKDVGGTADLSRDNNLLVFASGDNSRKYSSSLYLYNRKQNSRTRLAPGNDPRFNSNATQIVFDSQGSLYKIGTDGKDLLRLSPVGSFDSQPSFSPGGSHIVFTSSSRSARSLVLDKGKSDIYRMRGDGTEVRRITFGPGNNVAPVWGATPGVPYAPPPPAPPTPEPEIQSVAAPLPNEPLILRDQALASGELIYAFNDLQTAPYPSFLGAQTNGKTRNYRLDGPNLQGTDGDFVFDPQRVPGNTDLLLKLGDPAVRPRNPYNSYRLWKWNRQTNALTSAAPRELFFRTVAPAPDGNRIAYIAGGNALGQTPEENGGIGEALRLYVYNPQTKTETLVSDNPGVRGGFAWLDGQTLLYTAVPAPEKSALNPHSFARPAIYAFDVKSGQSRLLLSEERHPMPSPDGSRIAFWGLRPDETALPLPQNWWHTTGYTHLNVANREGGGRKVLERRLGVYPPLVWAPDNERMLLISQRPSSPQPQGHVEEWNALTGRTRQVVTLDAKDAGEVERAWLQPQFRALDVAPDGKTLFVSVEEVDEKNRVTTRVQAVDLAMGTVTQVAQLRDVAGFDWNSLEAIPATR